MLFAAGYIGVFVVAFLAVRARTILGPAVLVLADPLDLSHYVGPTTVTLFKVALVAVYAALLLRPRERDAAHATGAAFRVTLISLALLVIATAATIPVAFSHGIAIRETLKAVEYLLAFGAACACVRRDPAGGARVLGAALAATVCVTALAATVDVIAPKSALFIGTTPIVRIAGLLEGPNQFAAFLAIALPLLLVDVGAERRLRWTALMLGALALVATLSRGGIGAAVLGCVAVALLYRSHKQSDLRATIRGGATALATGVAIGLALELAGGYLLLHAASRDGAGALGGGAQHLFTLTESRNAGGVGTRSELWHAALILGRAHPLLGVGAGNFELLVGRFFPGVRTHANSLFLEAFADGGIVLLAATLVAAFTAPVRLLASRAPFAFAAGCAGLALALHGIIDDVTFYPKVGQLWWVCAGVGIAVAVAQHERRTVAR